MSNQLSHIPTEPKSTWSLQADQIIAQGYPAIAHLLPDLVGWLKDINWPGAHKITDFLASLGKPVLPHVSHVLQGNDRVWQYFVLNFLVDKWPREMVIELTSELMNLIWLADGEEVDIAALRQLTKHHLGDQSTIQRAIARKQQTYRELLHELAEFEQYLQSNNGEG